MRDRRHRMVMIGAGWIGKVHLAALERLGRTELVGVASSVLERAAAVAGPRGARAAMDVDALLESERPDVAYVAVPPGSAVAICDRLVERGIPFLTEKPLAADDAAGPARLARRIEERGLVVAVGYHLRSLEPMPEVVERLKANPAQLVTARWLDSTPPPPWWRVVAGGGGQVVEQATHLYDLARFLVGEAQVVAAAAVRADVPVPEGADVADSTAALLRFESGAIGTFANTRRLASPAIGVEFAAPGQLTRVDRPAAGPGGFRVTFDDGDEPRTLPAGRDPYELQAARFLDAVEAGDPDGVVSSYRDAVLTDRLTRAVVAATGVSA